MREITTTSATVSVDENDEGVTVYINTEDVPLLVFVNDNEVYASE